jgi:hypothetical protein
MACFMLKSQRSFFDDAKQHQLRDGQFSKSNSFIRAEEMRPPVTRLVRMISKNIRTNVRKHYALISTSTPLGKSSLLSASTVRLVDV